MSKGLRNAYLVLLGALAVSGLFLNLSGWTAALVGAAAMTPIAIADFVIRRRAAVKRAR